MAMPGSPSSFTNGYEEDPIFQKSHYTQDISEQMRVPKRIKATGEYYDDFDLPLGGNNGTSHWAFQEKIDMTVPDRIMVIGQEQVLGKREFVFLCYIPEMSHVKSENLQHLRNEILFLLVFRYANSTTRNNVR